MTTRIKLKMWMIQGLSLGALIGIASCGSFQMPESMKAHNIWGEDASGASTAQSSGIDMPSESARPMSPAQFDELKAQVAEEGMGRNKIALIEEAGRSVYFSAAQVGDLATLIEMKGDRVRLVEAIVDRILDLDNPGAITSQLTFADERSDVESIMSQAHAVRQKEVTRLAEARRIADENRVAEEEEKEQARRETEAAQSTAEPSTSASENSSNSSASCCLNGKYNACDSGAAAGACMGWGTCIFKCSMNGGSNCESKCTDEYPLIQECRADSSKDHLCNK